MTGTEAPAESPERPVADSASDSGGVPGMWTRQGPYLLDWTVFGVLADVLTQAVRADGFVPDVILAIARGGLVPGGYLACALDVPTTCVVRVRRTADDSRYAAKQSPVIDEWDDRIILGSRILIVDDIVGTGVTAHALLENLTATGIAEDAVRFASLVRNQQSGFLPHYCAAAIDDWIVFPWELDREPTGTCRSFPDHLITRR